MANSGESHQLYEPTSSPPKRRPFADFEEENLPRKRVAVACSTCRYRKTKCDGRRPTCSFCEDLGAKCIYKTVDRAVAQGGFYPELTSIRERLTRLEDALNGNRATNIQHSLSPYDAPTVTSNAHSEIPTSDPRDNSPPDGDFHSIQFQTPRDMQSSTLQDDARSSSVVQLQKPLALTILTAMAARNEENDNEQFSPNGDLGLGPTVLPQGASFDVPKIRRAHLESCLLAELDYGNQFNESIKTPISNQLTFPEFDGILCWRLAQSYFARVNSWYPVFDEDYTWAFHFSRAESSGFRENSLSLALVLLALALGNISEEGTRPSTDLSDLFGSRLFQRGYDILQRNSAQTNLTVIQCYVLATEYLMFNFKPLVALETICFASRKCLMLQWIRSRYGKAERESRLLNRASWCCLLLETELNFNLRFENSGLHRQIESMQLPCPEPDEEPFTFFLAAVSASRLRQAIELAHVENETYEVRHAPIIARELQKQLDEWFTYLPPSLKFSLDSSPLRNDRKSYLRLQYYCHKCMMLWPSVALIQELYFQEREHVALRLLQDRDLTRQCQACLESLVSALREMKERIYRRSQLTWSYCQASFALVIKLVVAHGIPAISSLLPHDWTTICQDVLSCLGIWRQSPSINLAHQALQDILTAQGIISSVVTRKDSSLQR